MVFARAKKYRTVLTWLQTSREKMDTPKRDIFPESLLEGRSTKTKTNVEDAQLRRNHHTS